MITLSVKQAIKQGYLEKEYTNDDFVHYWEKDNVRIEYNGNAIVGVDLYSDGGCTISCPVGGERLKEHCFDNLRPKLNIYT